MHLLLQALQSDFTLAELSTGRLDPLDLSCLLSDSSIRIF